MKLELLRSMSKARLAIKKRPAFTIVEILLAVAVFALFVVAFSGIYLYGQEASALAGNRSRAGLLAQEGLEAVQNIRDADFANLIDGTYGLAISSGQWIFSGTQDVINNFTRSITISTVDADRKSVVSNVSWQQNPKRTGSVTLSSRLTFWQKIVNLVTSGGLLVYGDGTTITKYRTYDSTTDIFGAQTVTPAGAIGLSRIIRTSPTKTEAISGYVTSAGVLRIMCYDGSSWTNDWSTTVGGNGLDHRFDIVYETNSGDVLVVYSTNASGTDELAYRTKPGSAGCGSGNWAGATNFDPIRTSGVISYVKLAFDRRAAQNLIAMTWVDNNDDLSGAIWNGSAFTNEPATVSDLSVQIVSGSHDTENMEIKYESLSGDVMMIWGTTVGSNANGVRYRTCTGGTSSCTWSAVTTPPTFNDDATTLDLSANPNTNEMVFASIGRNQNDLQIGYWSGSAWTNLANADTSCNTPVVNGKKLSTGWLINGGTTRSLVVYADQGSNNIDWYTGSGGAFTKQTDAVVTPAPNNPNGYYQIEMNPLSKDQVMFCVSDSANDLFCKRVVMSAAPVFTWTNSDGVALTTALPQSTASPFAFAFWRN